MISTDINYTDFDRLDRVLSAYAEAAQHGMQSAMMRTGRKLAFALHGQTKKISPTAASIRQKGRDLGWFDPARKHRKSPNPTARTPQVRAQMQRYRGPAGVLAARIFAIGFSARGWLPAIQGYAGVHPDRLAPPSRGGHFDRRWSHAHIKNLGWMRIIATDELLIIKMANDTTVIEDLTKRHALLSKAIDDVKQDMQAYIATHLNAAGQLAFARI